MSASEARREAVVAFLQSGSSVQAIQKKLGVSRATIFNIKKRLKVEGHVKRKSGSGAATTVATPSLVSKIRNRIRTNPVRTMRGMARELGVSEHTVRNVVKKKLGARSLARTKKFLLSDRLKALRVERCNKILAILKKKKQIILFSDEKYFSVDQVSNSRTNRYITNLRLEDVPDHVRAGFSIWAYVQAKSCDQQHPNLEHLKAGVTDVWNDLSVTYIRNVCKRFRPRVESVVAAEGGYIDK